MVSEERKAWARQYIRRAPEAPLYGSPEWLALPEGPEKVAAVVKAAECWRTEQEDEMARLRAQCIGAAMEAKRAADADWAEDCAQWRAEWAAKSWRPHPVNRGAS